MITASTIAIGVAGGVIGVMIGEILRLRKIIRLQSKLIESQRKVNIASRDLLQEIADGQVK